VVVFLTWLWLTHTAILRGAEFNAELERGRQIIGGHPGRGALPAPAPQAQAAQGRQLSIWRSRSSAS
jgi:membrane protein